MKFEVVESRMDFCCWRFLTDVVLFSLIKYMNADFFFNSAPSSPYVSFLGCLLAFSVLVHVSIRICPVSKRHRKMTKIYSREHLLSYSFQFMFSIMFHLRVMTADHTGTEYRVVASVRPFHISPFCNWRSCLRTLSSHFFWSRFLDLTYIGGVALHPTFSVVTP